MKRKLTFKAPFVTTIAAAALAACGGQVSGGGSSGTTNPPPNVPTECPAAQPAAGDPCDLANDTFCSYPGQSPCGVSMQCSNGSFQDVSGSCNPPPPNVCPVTAPAAGTSCFADLGPCTYEDGCQQLETATCAGNVWSVATQPYQVACPATMPTNGSPCGACATHYPPSCGYGDCQGQKNIFATCDPKTQSWSVTNASCNPPVIYDAGTGG